LDWPRSSRIHTAGLYAPIGPAIPENAP
jgi:hypothetical protein